MRIRFEVLWGVTMDNMNNSTPSGYSLDEVLAAVKAEKKRAQENKEEAAKAAEEERIRREEEEAARIEAEKQLRLETEARLRAEEEKRLRAEEEERLRDEEEKRYKEEMEARARRKYLDDVRKEAREKIEAEVRRRDEIRREAYRRIEEEARIRAEETAKLRAEEEERIRIEEEERFRQEQAERIRAEEEARALRAEKERREKEEQRLREDIRKQFSAEMKMTPEDEREYREKIRRRLRNDSGYVEPGNTQAEEAIKNDFADDEFDPEKLRQQIRDEVRREAAKKRQNKIYEGGSDALSEDVKATLSSVSREKLNKPDEFLDSLKASFVEISKNADAIEKEVRAKAAKAAEAAAASKYEDYDYEPKQVEKPVFRASRSGEPPKSMSIQMADSEVSQTEKSPRIAEKHEAAEIPKVAETPKVAEPQKAEEKPQVDNSDNSGFTVNADIVETKPVDKTVQSGFAPTKAQDIPEPVNPQVTKPQTPVIPGDDFGVNIEPPKKSGEKTMADKLAEAFGDEEPEPPVKKKRGFSFPFFGRRRSKNAELSDIDVDDINFSYYTNASERSGEKGDLESDYDSDGDDGKQSVNDNAFARSAYSADDGSENEGFRIGFSDEDEIENVPTAIDGESKTVESNPDGGEHGGFVIDYSTDANEQLNEETEVQEVGEENKETSEAENTKVSENTFDENTETDDTDNIAGDQSDSEKADGEDNDSIDESENFKDSEDSVDGAFDNIILEVAGKASAEKLERDNFSKNLDNIFTDENEDYGGYLASDDEQFGENSEQTEDNHESEKDDDESISNFADFTKKIPDLSNVDLHTPVEEEQIPVQPIKTGRSLFSHLGKLAQKQTDDYSEDDAVASKEENDGFVFDRDDDELNTESRRRTTFLPYGLDEYTDESNEPHIRATLAKLAGSSFVAMMLLVILSLAAAVINILPQFVQGLPSVLDPVANPKMFGIINILLIILGGVSANGVIKEAINSVKMKKISYELPVTVAFGLCLLYNIITMFTSQPAELAVCSLSPLALLALATCTFTNYIELDKLQNNFDFVAKGGKNSAFELESDNPVTLAADQYYGMDKNLIVGKGSSGKIKYFFESSFGDKRSSSLISSLNKLSAAGGAVIFIIALICRLGFVNSLAAGIATFILSSPIFVTAVINLKQFNVSKKCMAVGGTLTGTDSIEYYANTTAAVIGADELFDENGVGMKGLKFFRMDKTDMIIELAAAASIAAKSPLGKLLSSMLVGRTDKLPKVDSIHYKDDRGLTATIDGKQVLVGNSDLLSEYFITLPSKNFEEKIENDGNRVVYVAIDNELAAMFAVKYTIKSDVAERIITANNEGIGFVIYTTDPNVTSEFVEKQLRLTKGSVFVLPTKLMGVYMKTAAKEQNALTTVIHNGSFKGYLTAFVSAVKLCSVFKSIRFLQLVITAAVIVLSAVLTIIMGAGIFAAFKLLVTFAGICAIFGITMAVGKC